MRKTLTWLEEASGSDTEEEAVEEDAEEEEGKEEIYVSIEEVPSKADD